MIRRITITGTESTGKTELAQKLAMHYKTVCVPDYSRHYVERLERKYNHSDVLQIARGIMEEENKMLHYSHRVIFSDNDLINIKIWLLYYNWHVPDWLDEEIINRRSDLYLLCDIDIKWVADEQRKNPEDREKLFKQFKYELTSIGANYKIISGKKDKRLLGAGLAVDNFLAMVK